MAFDLDQTVKQLTDFLRNEVKTDTVVGQQFKLGEFTCVPIIKFGLGLGYGGGEGHGGMQGKAQGEGTGGGAGGGMGVAPSGFLVTRGDQIQFVSANISKGLGAAFEKVPELLEKFLDKKAQKKAGAAAA